MKSFGFYFREKGNIAKNAKISTFTVHKTKGIYEASQYINPRAYIYILYEEVNT